MEIVTLPKSLPVIKRRWLRDSGSRNHGGRGGGGEGGGGELQSARALMATGMILPKRR
jgi:hypothetical protein